MSKKAQTTGAPRRRRRRAQAADAEASAAKTSTPGTADDSSYVSRAEREEQLQKWVIRGAIVVVGHRLALLVAGAFAIEQLIVPNQSSLLSMAWSITVREFRQEYQLERNRLLLQLNQIQSSGFDMQQLAQQEPYKTWLSEVNVPDQLGLRVINDMVDDRLLAAEAASRNIQVDAAAVRRAVEEFFGYDPTQAALIGVEPTPTPNRHVTPTPFVSPTPTNTPRPQRRPTRPRPAVDATI